MIKRPYFLILVALILLAGSVACAAPFAAPTQSGIALPAKIETVAKDSLGKRMWSGYGLLNGYLGCAYMYLIRLSAP